jgi:hypothetical protein
MIEKTKAAGLRTRAASKVLTRNNDKSALAFRQVKRSADHWFLDAAVYALDGDAENARRAALGGLHALKVQP